MIDDELGEPAGLIEVDGEPMLYWLPNGLTAKDIGLEPETKTSAPEVEDELPPF